MSDDGISLTSAAHPVAPWYRRIWTWLRPPRLSEDSLETMEIDIKKNYDEPTKGLRLEFEPGICGLKFVADEKPYPEANGPADMAYINRLIELDEERRKASVRPTWPGDGFLVISGGKPRNEE